jgi:hypothetical protein
VDDLVLEVLLVFAIRLEGSVVLDLLVAYDGPELVEAGTAIGAETRIIGVEPAFRTEHTLLRVVRSCAAILGQTDEDDMKTEAVERRARGSSHRLHPASIACLPDAQATEGIA